MGLPHRSIWMDAHGTQSVAHPERGIARYIAEQAKAVVRQAPQALAGIGLDQAMQVPASLDSLKGSGVLAWRTGAPPVDPVQPSIYHVMSPFELATELDEVWPAWARRGNVRTVVTVYDLIPLIFPEPYLDPHPATSILYRARLGLLRRADQILTISECTADDVSTRLGISRDRITVIDCGVSGDLPALAPDRPSAESILRSTRPELREGFLLYVGGHDWRKNLEGMIQAYAHLPEGVRQAHQLVIVCKLTGAYEAELRETARRLGVDDDVLLTGFVDDRELAALYRWCKLFVFPSLYEGAGLPVLEAMACGAPVAASNTASIPEILGDREATFDPSEPQEIARCIQEILDDPLLLDALQDRSAKRVEVFTWDRVAERTIVGYERALASGRRARPRRRKRVALLSPWPPQPSGVANHSRHLVEELRSYADIDVIAPTNGRETELGASVGPEVKIWTEAQFDWLQGLREYDRFLYALGSSPWHTYAFDALMRRPGAVVLHDVRVLGLYLFVAQERGWRGRKWLNRKLTHYYGDRVSRSDLEGISREDVYVKNDIYMTQEVQARADQLILHSHYQSGVLELDSPTASTPHAIVPLGIPRAPEVPERTLAGDPLVISCGVVSITAKRMKLLLAAFARLACESPGARLVVMGEVRDVDRRALEKLAAAEGIQDRVTITGAVEVEEYWGTLRAADLAVQLRTGANGGEASGAVCDCIAARLPTIVSNIGWFAELPEGVVLRVPEDCTAKTLAERMGDVTQDEGVIAEMKVAQHRYSDDTSFERVAERYAEILAL